jgi:hypothetical protein
MDHTPVNEPFAAAEDGAAPPLTFWGRAVERPRASFADALSAGGGVIVTIGVLLIAADRYSNSGDGWQGALVFVALFFVANLALLVVREPFDAACTSAIVLSVPAVFGFLIFPTTDSFADVRLFLILTIVTWGLLFAFSNSRGRPILLALAAVLLYLWIVGEVADVDAYSANPVPSPTFASPSVLLDAVRGGTPHAHGNVVADTVSFRLQQVTLDDLDPTDPLYPLAVACDGGDLTACDELWSRAEPGSDFEAFADSCGGDASASSPCSTGSGDEDFFGDEITPGPSVTVDPFDETPLNNDNGKALPIGLVSLGFGALYLAAVHVCDRRRLAALGTAFVIPAVLALVTAAAAIGQWTGSAIWGGLVTLLIGVAIGVAGWLGTDRRFTTWGGGTIASVGAFIVAADVAPNPSPSLDHPDLVGTGLVVIAFGLAVVGLAWVAVRVLGLRPFSPPPSAPPAAPAPLPDPEPEAVELTAS